MFHSLWIIFKSCYWNTDAIKTLLITYTLQWNKQTNCYVHSVIKWGEGEPWCLQTFNEPIIISLVYLPLLFLAIILWISMIKKNIHIWYKMCVLIFSTQEELKVPTQIYIFMQSDSYFYLTSTKCAHFLTDFSKNTYKITQKNPPSMCQAVPCRQMDRQT
jgi:hypothetical protein